MKNIILKILFIALLMFIPKITYGAIAHDATSIGSNWGAGSSQTWSHTVSGSDRLLIVSIFIGGTADNVSGVTYNGDSMTRYLKLNDSAGNQNLMYYMYAPDTGTNNVVVSFSSSINSSIVASSYTGVKQSDFPDSGNTYAGRNAPGPAQVTFTTTTVADNCWLVVGFRPDGYSSWTADSGTTDRVNSTVVNELISDSGGAKTPAGSHSLSWDSDGRRYWGVILVSISPAEEPATSRRIMLIN